MKDYFYYHDPTESNHSSECRLDTEILEKVKVGLIQNLYSIIENNTDQFTSYCEYYVDDELMLNVMYPFNKNINYIRGVD